MGPNPSRGHRHAGPKLEKVGVIPVGSDRRLPGFIATLERWGGTPIAADSPRIWEFSAVLVVAPSLDGPESEASVDRLLRRHPDPPIVLVADEHNVREFIAARVIRHVCWVDRLAPGAVRASVAAAAADGALAAVRRRLLQFRSSSPSWLARSAVEHVFQAPSGPPPEPLERSPTFWAAAGAISDAR